MSKLQQRAEELLASHKGDKESAQRALKRVAAIAAFVLIITAALSVIPLFFIDAQDPATISTITRILIGIGILACWTFQVVTLVIIVYSLRIKAIIYKL